MAVLDSLAIVFAQFFELAQSTLYNYLGVPIISFTKGFELAIAIIVAIVFFLATGLIVLKQAKKLPNRYKIKVHDVYGEEVSPEGLKLEFMTYDAAESFSRSYKETFGHQYRFRVTGSDS